MMTNREWLFSLSDRELALFLCGDDFKDIKKGYIHDALGVESWLAHNAEDFGEMICRFAEKSIGMGYCRIQQELRDIKYPHIPGIADLITSPYAEHRELGWKELDGKINEEQAEKIRKLVAELDKEAGVIRRFA